MHLADLQVVARGDGRKRCQRVRLTRSAIGIPSRAKYFLSQSPRNAHVRPEGIVNSFTVQASRQGIDNAVVQQALKRARRVVRRDQVEFGLDERVQ